LAIIRLGDLTNNIENQTIYDNMTFVPEDLMSDFPFPFNKIKLKKLTESWEKSIVEK